MKEKLTKVEEKMLSYLRENKDRLVSVDELLEEVWKGVIVSRNSPATVICKLRRRGYEIELKKRVGYILIERQW